MQIHSYQTTHSYQVATFESENGRQGGQGIAATMDIFPDDHRKPSPIFIDLYDTRTSMQAKMKKGKKT